MISAHGRRATLSSTTWKQSHAGSLCIFMKKVDVNEKIVILLYDSIHELNHIQVYINTITHSTTIIIMAQYIQNNSPLHNKI